MLGMKANLASEPLEGVVVLYRDGPLIEEHMAVRTEAQNVLRHVGTVVRTAKGPNVCSLSIRTNARLEPSRTHLAAVIMPAA